LISKAAVEELNDLLDPKREGIKADEAEAKPKREKKAKATDGEAPKAKAEPKEKKEANPKAEKAPKAEPVEEDLLEIPAEGGVENE